MNRAEQARLSRLSQAVAQLRRYGSVLADVARDGVWRDRRTSAHVAALSVVAVILRAQALVIVLTYARHLESGEPWRVLSRTYDPRGETAVIVAVAVASVALLGLSGLTGYLAGRGSVQAGRRYQVFCAQRVLALVGEPPARFGRQLSWSEPTLLRIEADARYCGRTVRVLLRALPSFLIAPAALAVLVVLDLWLSAALFVVLGSAAFALYRVNRAGARHSHRLERLHPRAREEVRAFLTGLRYTTLPGNDVDSRLQSMFARGSMRAALDAYHGRLLVLEQSRLINQLLAAAAVFVILTVHGLRFTGGTVNWSSLLVYLVALRYFLTHLAHVVQTATSVGRFYPQLRRYFAFVRATRQARPAEEPPTDWTLHTAVEPLHGGDQSAIGAGHRVGFVTGPPADRYSLCLLHESFGPQESGRQILGHPWFIARRTVPQGRTLRDLFGLPPGMPFQDLVAALPALPESVSDTCGSMDIDSPWSDDSLLTLPAPAYVALTAVAIWYAKPSCVVVESEALTSAPPAFVDWLDTIASQMLLVVTHRWPHVQPTFLGQTLLVFCDGRNELCWAPAEWVVGRLDAIGARLDMSAGPQRPAVAEDDEFSDELVV